MLFRAFHSDSKTEGIGLEWPTGPQIQDQHQMDPDCIKVKVFGVAEIIFACSGINFMKKSNIVVSHFEKASSFYGSNFYVNFASANYYGISIGEIALVVNENMIDYFKSNSKKKIGCIVPLDYPNRTPGLVNMLIQHNFKS